jgi:transcriptional regulator with XRE-family HTH domain
VRNTTFSERLKIARQAAGLTQKQLGRLVNQAATTIANLEQGNTASSTKTVELARALGVRGEWLAEGREPMVAELKSNHAPVAKAAAAPPAGAYTFTADDLVLAQRIARLQPAQRQAILAILQTFNQSREPETVGR